MNRKKTKPVPTRPEWATRVEKRMRELELTQSDLIDVLGVKTRGSVGHYLQGRRQPSIPQMRALAAKLRLEVGELLGDKQPRNAIVAVSRAATAAGEGNGRHLLPVADDEIRVSLNSAARRVRYARLQAGLTQQELGNLIGVTKASVSGWETEESKSIHMVNLFSIEEATGFAARWIATGTGPEKVERYNGELVGRGDGYIRVALMGGFAGAGDGGSIDEVPETVRYLDVSEEWFKSKLRAPTDAVKLITAKGDSMAPDIQSGDVLFVDSRVQHLDAAGVYVMHWNHRLMVKRLQPMMDGRVAIKSSNPAYETEYVPAALVDHLHVRGRVLGTWALRAF